MKSAARYSSEFLKDHARMQSTRRVVMLCLVFAVLLIGGFIQH